MYTLWLICVLVLSQWAMWLQSAVLAGGHLPSTYDTVPVHTKGIVRYVPQDLAYRYDSSFFVLVICMFAYLCIARVAKISDEA